MIVTQVGRWELDFFDSMVNSAIHMCAFASRLYFRHPHVFICYKRHGTVSLRGMGADLPRAGYTISAYDSVFPAREV